MTDEKGGLIFVGLVFGLLLISAVAIDLGGKEIASYAAMLLPLVILPAGVFQWGRVSARNVPHWMGWVAGALVSGAVAAVWLLL